MAVLVVTDGEEIDPAGDLTPVLNITFTVDGRPGSFHGSVPKTGDPVAAAAALIADVTAQVSGIYNL